VVYLAILLWLMSILKSMNIMNTGLRGHQMVAVGMKVMRLVIGMNNIAKMTSVAIQIMGILANMKPAIAF
jgi:hypothetical protein